MARENAVEVELLDGRKCSDPIVGVAVGHVGHPRVNEISGAEDPFLWEEDERVSVGMASTEKQDLHLAVATAEDQAFLETHCGQDVPDILQLFEIGFFEGDLSLQIFPFSGVGCGGELAPTSFDASDIPAESFAPGKLCFDPRNAAVDNSVARRLGGDHLDAGKGLPVCAIALEVIVMKVRIDHVADGLVGDRMDLFD